MATEHTDSLEYRYMNAKNIEDWMLNTIAENLNTTCDQVRRDAPFTSLGLDSLRLLELSGDLAEFIDCDIPVTLLWEFPTIDSLSQELEALTIEQDEAGCQALAPRDQAQPLTFSQERIWNFANHDKQGDGNNIFECWKLSGALNIVAFTQSISAIIERHEILRTTFQIQQSSPVQMVQAFRAAPILNHDLSNENDPEASADEALNVIKKQPVYIQGEELFHVFLYKLSDTSHRVAFRFHHLVYDAISLEIFYKELNANHNALIAKAPLPEHSPTLAVFDFAQRQRARLATDTEAFSKMLNWWIECWTKPPASKRLKFPARRRKEHTLQGDEPSFYISEIPQPLLLQARELSAQTHATEYTILFAAYIGLLYSYGNRGTITMGSYISDRSESSVQKSIGFFINLLALRIDLNSKPNGLSIIESCRSCISDSTIHQELPFEMLAVALKERGYKRPRIETIFQKIPLLTDSLQLAELEIQRWTSSKPPPNTWGLTMDILEGTNGRLSARFRFDPRHYQPVKVEHMLKEYFDILEQIVTQPEKPIPSLKRFGLFSK